MSQILRFRELEDESGYRLVESAGVKSITCSLSDPPQPGAIYLVPGRLLTPECLPSLRQTIRLALAAYAHCVLYSPFALNDLAPLLSCTGTFRIHDGNGTKVQWQANWKEKLPTQLVIAYAGIIQTSYQGGLRAVGEREEPVLVSYRPSSVHGQAVITTLLVASPNIRTRESHRRTLLRAMLDHLAADAPPGPPGDNDEINTVPREVVNTVALAIYCGAVPSPAGIARFASDRLSAELSDDAIIAALAFLESQGILTADKPPGQNRLEMFVNSHNLDSLARMLLDER